MYIVDSYELIKNNESEKDIFSILTVKTQNDDALSINIPNFLNNCIIREIGLKKIYYKKKN